MSKLASQQTSLEYAYPELRKVVQPIGQSALDFYRLHCEDYNRAFHSYRQIEDQNNGKIPVTAQEMDLEDELRHKANDAGISLKAELDKRIPKLNECDIKTSINFSGAMITFDFNEEHRKYFLNLNEPDEIVATVEKEEIPNWKRRFKTPLLEIIHIPIRFYHS